MSNSDWILLCTLLVVAWYAWEARKSAHAIEKQNEINILPFFSIEFVKNESGQERLYIENIGNGTALNISYNVTNSLNNVSVEISGVPILKKGQSKRLNEELVLEGTRHGIELVTYHFTYGKNPIELKIVICFEDICGKKYKQAIIADKDGIKPQKIEKTSR